MGTSGTTSQRAKPRKLNETSHHRPVIEAVNSLPLEDFRKLYWPESLEDEVRNIADVTLEKVAVQEGQRLGDTTAIAPREHVSSSLQSSARLSKSDLSACFDLFKDLNRVDYLASSFGWHPAKKKAEMKLPDLKYYMLWGNTGDNKSKVDSTSSNGTVNGAATSTRSPTRDDNLLAFISFMPTYEDGYEVIYIYEIHVAPALQGHGIGPKMIGIVEEVGRKIGAKKAMLTVFRSNERARAVYERKLGWEIDEFSPADRIMRGGQVKQSDYVILSKKLLS